MGIKQISPTAFFGEPDVAFVAEPVEQEAVLGAGPADQEVDILNGLLVLALDGLGPDGGDGDVPAPVDFGHADGQGVGAVAVVGRHGGRVEA
jgi:hypothetical protein